ncbi:hypothetical protein NPIL_382601 [Nephila pilipes]|uniref:Uncharacterized protein n=1 Tax=Nephila pilipes TaxID=299642 RepID=A0A8X6P366_NEPPI|nr:hypothetical protein NPIL_382601 [Nephila pilipes]
MKDGYFDDKWDKERNKRENNPLFPQKNFLCGVREQKDDDLRRDKKKVCCERFFPLPLVQYVIFDAGIGGRCGRCGHQFCDFGHLRD